MCNIQKLWQSFPGLNVLKTPEHAQYPHVILSGMSFPFSCLGLSRLTVGLTSLAYPIWESCRVFKDLQHICSRFDTTIFDLMINVTHRHYFHIVK